MKKVLAIVSSPRKGGNSELLADEFVKGAREAGNDVEKMCLRKKRIAPCLACEACLRNGGTCVQKDDMAEVLRAFIDADVVVLSTPVYYYSVCAQLKAMIDRTLPLGADGGKTGGKEFYFIVTAAERPAAMERTMADLQGFVDCIPDSTVDGKVYGQAFGVGEIKGKPAMEEAYRLGLSCWEMQSSKK